MHDAKRQRGGFNVGCLVAIVIVLVLGVAGAFFIGRWGLSLVAEEVKRDIRDHPVVLEHIGDIEECTVNLAATGAEGEEAFVFDLKGSKSHGELQAVIETGEDGTERVLSGTLRMPDGTRHELFPDGRPPETPTDEAPSGDAPPSGDGAPADEGGDGR